MEVFIVPTLNGLPIINQIGAYRPTEPTEHGAKFAFYSGGQESRVEYEDIIATTDASAPTEFLLPTPAIVQTNKEYAVIIKFDGSENFILWGSKVGDPLVDTGSPSPGPSENFTGALYTFIDSPLGVSQQGYAYTNNTIVAATANNPALVFTSQEQLGTSLVDPSYLQANWSRVPATNLKFNMSVARFAAGGVWQVANTDVTSNALITSSADRPHRSSDASSVVSNNVIRLTAQVEVQEYILFDRKTSKKRNVYFGEPVYQDVPYFPGGDATPFTVTAKPVITTSNTDYVARLVEANGSFLLDNATTFDAAGGWNTFTEAGWPLIITAANNNVEVRLIAEIVSNTELLVDFPFDETLTGAKIQMAPVAYINDISPSFVYGRNQDILTLYDSHANTSHRFVSHALSNTVTVTSGGTGYANSDYVRVACFEDIDFSVKGNYSAYANIVTNGSGVITAVHMSNLGAGFVNSSFITGANIEILTSTGGTPSETPSGGSSADLDFTVGSSVRSAWTNTEFTYCSVINLEAVRMKPEITVNNPSGTGFTIKHRSLFYKVKDTNTSLGAAYYCNTQDEQEATDTYVKIFKAHDMLTNEDRIPVIPSRSNQYVIRYANGEVLTDEIYGFGFSNSVLFIFDVTSNSNYQIVYFDPEICNSHYAKYIINRDYTNEHTIAGEAWAKHIGTKINFQADRFAEDLVVYLNAYRPTISDLKVYGRLHNSKDNEEFDDKDWSWMDLTDGVNVFSSGDDSADEVELTFNLPPSPNTDHMMEGVASVSQGNAVVTGTNTIFGATFNIDAGGTGFTNGDFAIAAPPTQATPATGIYAWRPWQDARGTIGTDGSGVITSISVANSGYGFVSQVNVSTVSVTNSTGGATSGSGETLTFRPGLAANDLIKVYSPLFPETNYTLQVVNAITNNTSFTVKRVFGQLSANLVGTVTVNTTSTEMVGSGTSFDTDFTNGDFIAVWANSSLYEVRKIASITDSDTLDIDAGNPWTIDNSGLSYAYVTPDTFVNTSIAASNVVIDKIALKHQAFRNVQNDNVARYYSLSMVPYDGYDTFQIKIVLLSESDIRVPKVDDVRGVGVTA